MTEVSAACEMQLTAVIEQTYQYRKKMKYIAETNSFIEKNNDSLGFSRKVKQKPPYGWIKESATQAGGKNH